MKRISWLLQFILIAVITLPVALLPYRIALKAGDLLGLLLYAAWGSRRKTAVDNLRSAIQRNALSIETSPELVIRNHFRNLGRSAAEIIKVYYGLDRKVFENIQISGIENFSRAAAKGKGILMITGHCGNWELVGLPFSLKISKLHVIVRRVDNPWIDRLIVKTRQKYGNVMIYKQGALKKVLSVLKNNGCVGILMDQSVVPDEGVAAEFLGKKDYIMKTPALIARKTGAAVLPVFMSRTERGHLIEIGEEIALDDSDDPETALFNDTVRFSARIEDFIRRHPSEWLWIHRRWKRIKE